MGKLHNQQSLCHAHRDGLIGGDRGVGQGEQICHLMGPCCCWFPRVILEVPEPKAGFGGAGFISVVCQRVWVGGKLDICHKCALQAQRKEQCPVHQGTHACIPTLP